MVAVPLTSDSRTGIVHHTNLPLDISSGKETDGNPGGTVPRWGEVIIQSGPKYERTGPPAHDSGPPFPSLQSAKGGGLTQAYTLPRGSPHLAPD